MTQILVAYDSMSGNTKKLADAIGEGASSVDGSEVVVKNVKDVDDADLKSADGILLGSPTHMGGISAGMKTFIDSKLSTRWMQGGLPGKIGAVFTASSSDHGGHELSLIGLLSPMFALGMTIVTLPPMKVRENTSFGYSFGAGSSTGMGQGDKKPDANELAVAKALGKRVAEVAAKMNGG